MVNGAIGQFILVNLDPVQLFQFTLFRRDLTLDQIDKDQNTHDTQLIKFYIYYEVI
jgi:hypothetical protein